MTTQLSRALIDSLIAEAAECAMRVVGGVRFPVIMHTVRKLAAKRYVKYDPHAAVSLTVGAFMYARGYGVLPHELDLSVLEQEDYDRLVSVIGPHTDVSEMIRRYLDDIERLATALTEEVIPYVHERVTWEIEDTRRTVAKMRLRLFFGKDMGDLAKTCPVPMERVQGEKRAKGTDAVAQTSETPGQGNLHGGDGNSGEVEHLAKTKSQEHRDSSTGGETADSAKGDGTPASKDAAPNKSATPDGPSSEGAAASDCRRQLGQAGEQSVFRTDAPAREGGGMPTGQGESAGEEPSQEMGTTQETQRGRGNERAARGGSTPATGHGQLRRLGNGRQPEVSDGEAGSPDRTPARAHNTGGEPSSCDMGFGGETLTENRVVRHRRNEIQAARILSDKIKHLILRAAGMNGETTPRINAKQLVIELVSHRGAIERARRRDSRLRPVLILLDQSGSCAGVVDNFYRSACALTKVLPVGHINIVLHSNGFCPSAGPGCGRTILHAINQQGKALQAFYYSKTQRIASENLWQKLSRSLDLGMVIAFGDHDADWTLDLFAQAGHRVLAFHHNQPNLDVGHKRIVRIGPVINASTAVDAIEQAHRLAF